MTHATLLAETRRRLKASVDVAYRDGAVNFFKEPIDCHGVRSPEVKRIESDVYREWKHWPRTDQIGFCEKLWRSGKFEEGSIAIYLNRRLARTLGMADFEVFEKWIDRWVRNWAHTDGVSSWLLAAAIANEPGLMRRLPGWTRSENRWKRRAAAVSFLQEAKQGRNTDRILAIADRMLDDEDEMVQKGVGWLLKETYPKQPIEVVQYLLARPGHGSRLLLRYAAEKMTPTDRRRVMARE